MGVGYSNSAGRRRRRPAAACLLLACIGVAVGCAPRKLAVRPVRYAVDIKLDPLSQTLAGHATVEMARLADAAPAKGRAAVELKLHPDLTVESIEVVGATVRARQQREGRAKDESVVAPTTHRLVVEQAAEQIRMNVVYRGRLAQDIAAGEKPGEIHNFAVSAHVGEDGVYLDEDGYWYPVLALDTDDDPELALADFRLTADPIEGFELVAGLERDDAPADGRLHWQSRYPLEGMVLLGGPLVRWSRRHGDVELHAVLAPDKEEVADDILDAAAEYLERYEPLVGPYPFDDFTVLEAFFSSGFAFPTCTQIVGSQLSVRRQYRRHGYLDHELLHNWWGNGVYVDPRDGNWCEGLASYMGNYYGYLLDGDEQGARKQRRNHSNFLSSLEAQEDKPLGTFGLDDGAGRGIGYMKGAAVFQMLENKIGADSLFAGLRRLRDEHLGRMADWDDLQAALEQESGEDLRPFFDQWVRGSGAPLLRLTGAEWKPGSDRVAVTLSQEPSAFQLDVPLRLYFDERSEDVVVHVDEPIEHAVVPCATSGLTAVELDPDYQVFRRLKPAETMPTSSLTRHAERLLVVVPDEPMAEPYQQVVDSFRRAVLGDPDDPQPGHEVTSRAVGEVTADELHGASVLVLGDAVRHPTIVGFLERTSSPVRWTDTSFFVEDEEFAGAGQAVFLTVHHPDRERDGVTVYYGNSPAALANARLLSYYANSLLVFDTPATDGDDEPAPHGMPSTRVVRRIDFEFHDRIEF